jgi:sec-independent protein translocase protein TatA
MLGDLGVREILLIVLVVLVFFGSKRIPALAGSFGKTIRAFRRGIRDGAGD